MTIQIIHMGRDHAPRRPLVTPEERDLFLESISGTVPLGQEERDRVLAAPEPGSPPPALRDPLPPPIALTVEGDGSRISARAPGVNRAQISDLRAGRVRPEASLDLHGRTAAEAEVALRAFLLEARTLRRRCVLVIHGRGLGILRDTVITAMVGSMSGLVHGFASAARSDGGEGATYVMVRS